MAVKIHNQLKCRSPFPAPSPHRPQCTPKGFSSHNKVDLTPTPIEAFDKDKGIASEPPKRLEGKKCFKCHGYRHFQANCPNRRTLFIREVEEIQAIEEEQSEKEYQVDDDTLVTTDVGELLVIQRALYANEVPLEPS